MPNDTADKREHPLISLEGNGFTHVPKAFVHANKLQYTTHQRFSAAIANVFAGSVLTLANDIQSHGKRCLVVATCAYTPSFFYDRIRQRVERNGDLAALEAFETAHGTFRLGLCADPRYDVSIDGDPSPEVHRILEDACEAFGRAAAVEFPHFAALRDLDNALREYDLGECRRICLFRWKDEYSLNTGAQLRWEPGIDYPGTDPQYLADFRRKNSRAAIFAFFAWLNGNVTCRVLPPSTWESWGFNRGARDFALICQRSAELLDPDIVEYYDDAGFCLYGRQVNDEWPFVNIPYLLTGLSSPAKWDTPWTPGDFWEAMYVARMRTGTSKPLERFKVFVAKWAAALQERGETTVDENKYCSTLLDILDEWLLRVSGLSEYELRTLKDSPAFKAVTALKPKEVVKDLGGFIQLCTRCIRPNVLRDLTDELDGILAILTQRKAVEHKSPADGAATPADSAVSAVADLRRCLQTASLESLLEYQSHPGRQSLARACEGVPDIAPENLVGPCQILRAVVT